VRGAFSAHFINLAALRHPISADLFIEKTVPGTKAILLRLLGGLDYWRYGAEELAHACRKHGVTLAVLSGDGRADPRLPPLSTVDAVELDALDRLLAEGGPQNASIAISALMARSVSAPPVDALPEFGVYRETGPAAGGSVAIIFYRSFLLAGDVQPVDALFDTLASLPSPRPSPAHSRLGELASLESPHPRADADGRGDAFSAGTACPLSHGERAGVRGESSELAVRAYYVPSLKAAGAAEWLREQFHRNPPGAIVNTTAFSARGEDAGSPLDDADCPVIQAALAGSSEEAWRKSSRALSSTDLAMHVVLPELDGRIFAGAISFKDREASGAVFHQPHAQGIEHVAGLAAAWVRLRRLARQERKLALILSTYPGRPDQIAHAVGLDGPASALKIARHLRGEGYNIEHMPECASELLSPFLKPKAPSPLPLSRERRGEVPLTSGTPSQPAQPAPSPLAGEGWGEGAFSSTCWPLSEYEAAFARLPEAFREAVASAWGSPAEDPAFASGAIALPVSAYGNLLICLQPERGHLTDRKAAYHDPNLPPRHAYIAFYLWLRELARIDALIHLGAHGTLEWLPGKATALSEACAPRALLGPVPVVYPFIVNDPGEAAQAKRRISAVTIGHNTPPLIETASSPALREIERLLDEYSAAEGLDKRRRERLARDVLSAVAKGGLDEACGIKPEMTEAEALMRVDAFLCDVKALAIRDGLHILDETELAAISRALDGRFIQPGPSGAPSRGRADVLPTGRNLYSVDPRIIPTPLACEHGERMAEAIIARYVEDHGDWPRSMVLDLWGSQTMRTGGEEIGTALALLGVKPVWDPASFRVTGFEIVPLMKLNRPRVDVTLRISGLLRDMFPAQLAFFHAAVQRVAARDEPESENPLRRQRGELRSSSAKRDSAAKEIYRIFGAADGAYGAGVSQRIDAGDWQTPGDLAESYLAASSTAYTGESDGVAARAAFEQRVKAAEGFVHVQDHREIDVLSSLDFPAHEGGFAAAARALGNSQAALYHADAAAPQAPRVRSLAEEATRVLHGRALSGKWIEGQMRHGFRGAAEIAGTADVAFAFAATSGAIGSEGLEHLYEAYLGDPTVASFLARENGAALSALQSRFKEAIERSLWKPRRNDLSGLEGGE
jgi:cobaltochelatase CobN